MLSRRIARFKKPLALRRVRGHSMQPTLKDGQLVIFSSFKKPQNNSIVLAVRGTKEYVKRLRKNGDKHSLYGDNLQDSLDFELVDSKSVQAGLLYPAKR